MSQSPSNSSSNSNGEDNSLPQTSPSTWYVHIPLSPSYAHCNIILFDALCAALQAGRYQISSSPETTRGFVIEVRGRYTRPEAIWRAAYGIAQRRLEFWRMAREMSGGVRVGVGVERGLGRLKIGNGGEV